MNNDRDTSEKRLRPERLSLPNLAMLFVATALSGAMMTAVSHAHPPLDLNVKSFERPSQSYVHMLETDIAKLIAKRFDTGSIPYKYSDEDQNGVWTALRHAYAQSLFVPLWNEETAQKLLIANREANEIGIDAAIDDKSFASIVIERFEGDVEDCAEADMALSALWLQLAWDMSQGFSDDGRMVRSSESRITRSRLVQAIKNAATVDPLLEMEKFKPLPPQYKHLQNQWERYIAFAREGGWKKIRDDRALMEPGDTDFRVLALRQRLKAEGFLDDELYAFGDAYDAMYQPTYYGPDLVESVRQFQKAHGLKQDGIIGPSTLSALNESVESKIDRLEKSMQYWRENADLGDQHIWVNIPSYRAEGYKDGKREIAMKTIVGKVRTPSITFSDEIEYIVANPKWYLPIGLFKRQKLRKLRKDPGYAEKHNYTIYDRSSGQVLNPFEIDWSEPGISRQIQMVQGSGPSNALGRVKIMFPNAHAIYLHDTPNRELFERDERALSSGCIRLERPVEMAKWLTSNDEAVATNVFDAVLASGERVRFNLDRHVPVHLTYLSATVRPDGQVEFPRDIYAKFDAFDQADGFYEDYAEPILVEQSYNPIERTADYDEGVLVESIIQQSFE